MLACVFEIGQATVLASLLLSENKNKLMPWALMIILTTVQVIGNVYSCFKFISMSEINYYQYLQKPLLFWINGISEETVMIIISYIIGALLPIVALCMTTMVANNLKLKNNTNDLIVDDNIEIENIKENKNVTSTPIKIESPNKEEINSQIDKTTNQKTKQRILGVNDIQK